MGSGENSTGVLDPASRTARPGPAPLPAPAGARRRRARLPRSCGRERGGLRGRLRAPRARHPLLLPPHARLPGGGRGRRAAHVRGGAPHLLGEERDIALKPWLYAIARNRCLSILRARREQPLDELEPSTAGLAEEVQRRAELRAAACRRRATCPPTSAPRSCSPSSADLSHAEVAGVLDCEAARVKGLVFRARAGADRAPRRPRRALRGDPRAAREPARGRAPPRPAAPPPARLLRLPRPSATR